jgi:hypothetical protein
VNLVLLAFVVLLPFTTDALGQFRDPLATAVFAGNVAVISSTEAVMSVLAWREGLMSVPPSRRLMRLNLVPQLVPSAVFLALIPVAYLVSSSAAPAVMARAPGPQPDGRCPGQPPCHPGVTSGEGFTKAFVIKSRSKADSSSRATPIRVSPCR